MEGMVTLDRAASGASRRQWTPRGHLGWDGRLHESRKLNLLGSHHDGHTQGHPRLRRNPRATETPSGKIAESARTSPKLHSLLLQPPSLRSQYSNLPIAILYSDNTPLLPRIPLPSLKQRHSLHPPHNRNLPNMRNTPTVAGSRQRAELAHAR